MIIVTVIFFLAGFLIIGFGVVVSKSKHPVSIFANLPKIKAEKITDIRLYNRACAKMLIFYGVGVALLGIPCLWFEQNSPLYILIVLAVILLTIALLVMTSNISSKYYKTKK